MGGIIDVVGGINYQKNLRDFQSHGFYFTHRMLSTLLIDSLVFVKGFG